jgi:hypothetical protein
MNFNEEDTVVRRRMKIVEYSQPTYLIYVQCVMSHAPPEQIVYGKESCNDRLRMDESAK